MQHPVAQHQDLVDPLEDVRAMGDEKDRRPHGLQVRDRLHQRRLSLVIEVGVGFVEHHQHRLTIEGARQPDTLPLPAGEHGSADPDRSVIPLGQTQDHVMHAGALRRLDDLFGIDRAEARDVLAHRPLEEFDVLGQITDMRSQFFAVPATDLSAIQTHGSSRRGPHSEHHTRQCRLAGRTRSDHANDLARRHIESDALEHRRVRTGWGGHDILERDPPDRVGQTHVERTRRHRLQQAAQTTVGATGGQEAFPGADQHVDRGERPPHQDRAGDHHARGDDVLDGQIGANAEHQRLQSDAQRLAGVRQQPGAVAGDGLESQHLDMAREPALAHLRQHAHGVQGLGVAQVAL